MDQQAYPRGRREQSNEQIHPIEELLEVVQHEQALPRRQIVEQLRPCIAMPIQIQSEAGRQRGGE